MTSESVQTDASQPRARYQPQGASPKPWVASISGELLRNSRGGVRRFSTEQSAKRAAESQAAGMSL